MFAPTLHNDDLCHRCKTDIAKHCDCPMECHCPDEWDCPTKRKPTFSGEEIKAIRTKAHLTVQAFSTLLGVTASTVTRWETSRQTMSPLAAASLKRLLAKLDERGARP